MKKEDLVESLQLLSKKTEALVDSKDIEGLKDMQIVLNKLESVYPNISEFFYVQVPTYLLNKL